MSAKRLVIGLMVITAVLVSLAAILIISAGRNTPESKKQASLGSCTEFGNSLIGLSEASAIEKLSQSKRPYRIAKRNNEEYPLSQDFSPDRINLALVDGKVASFGCY